MEIDSPPFPKTSTNPAGLYNHLVELDDWVRNQREWASSNCWLK